MVGLLVLIGLVVALVGSIWLSCFAIENENTAGIFVATGIVSGVVLGCLLLAFPVIHASDLNMIQEFKATRETIVAVRAKEVSEIERATLAEQMIKANNWLARAKYWNSGTWDYWIPDAVMELEPLK